MLILTRRVGESIVINGQEIVVTILGFNGNQIRLGVEAPEGMSIHREEIYRRILNESDNQKELRIMDERRERAFAIKEYNKERRREKMQNNRVLEL